MKRLETILLLTATVNPDGMSFTVLQDPEERARQYREALDFYLQHTKLRIVFCENSNVDLSGDYQKQVAEGRIEFLTFEGNDYDKRLGKGYGEARIILYALNHSAFLKDDCYLVKITGRVIITNIRNMVEGSLWCRLQHFVRCDFLDNKSIYTMIIATPSKWMNRLHQYKEEINDTDGICFEQVLRKMLLQSPDISVLPFCPTPIISGIHGSSGCRYESIIPRDIIVRDFNYIFHLLKEERKYAKAYCARCVYLFLFFYRKVFRYLHKTKQP